MTPPRLPSCFSFFLRPLPPPLVPSSYPARSLPLQSISDSSVFACTLQHPARFSSPLTLSSPHPRRSPFSPPVTCPATPMASPRHFFILAYSFRYPPSLQPRSALLLPPLGVRVCSAIHRAKQPYIQQRLKNARDRCLMIDLKLAGSLQAVRANSKSIDRPCLCVSNIIGLLCSA